MNFFDHCNPVKSHQFLLFFGLVSIFSLFAYGIDAGSHHTYNIYYHHIVSNPNKFLGTPLELILVSKGIKLFNVGLASVILNPIGVVVMAILCNTVILFVSYQIARVFLEDTYAFVLVIILGLVANSPLAGFHDNELMFTRKTVTVVLVLTSFLCYFRERYIVAGMIAAGALFLHPTNALSALLFFMPGFAFYVYRTRIEKMRALVFGLSAPLLVIGFTYISSQDLAQGTLHVSVIEWYRYSLLLEADDVTMAWKLREGAPHLVPLLILSFVISILYAFKRGTHGNNALSWICITQLPIVLLILALETIQIHGFHLGVASELFSGIQLRRGIWVPMLSAFLLLQIYINQLPQESRTIWILSLIVAAVLDHTPLTILIFLVIALFLLREKMLIFSVSLSIMGVVWYITVHAPDSFGANQIAHVLFFTSLVIIFIFVRQFKGLKIALVSVLLAHSTIVLVNNNIRHDVLRSSYDYLVSPENYRNQQAKEELEVFIALNGIKEQKNSAVMFAPISLGYSASIISNRPILFSRWDNTLIFSKILYERFLEKVNDLDVSLTACNIEHTSNIDCVLGAVGRKIDTLTEEEIAPLMDKYNIGYVVRGRPLPGRIPIFTNSRFSVYQL